MSLCYPRWAHRNLMKLGFPGAMVCLQCSRSLLRRMVDSPNIAQVLDTQLLITVFTYIYFYIYICTYKCMYICICIYIYIYVAGFTSCVEGLNLIATSAGRRSIERKLTLTFGLFKMESCPIVMCNPAKTIAKGFKSSHHEGRMNPISFLRGFKYPMRMAVRG